MTLVKPLILLCLAALLAACGGGGDYFAPRYALQNLALSPDGHLLAVRFFDRELKRPGFGLYDWEHGKFTPIRNLGPDKSFSEPSFSPDGKKLVAVAGNQIQLIDLASLTVTQLTESGQGFKEAPIFLPDSSGILYVISTPARFSLLNLADGQEKQMLDAAIGFSTISRPYFGGPDRIIFAASGPRIPALYEQVEKFPGSRPATDMHIYGMKFGELPELILNNLWVEEKKKSRWFTGEANPQASKDAKRIIFTDYVANAKGPENNVNQELFEIEDGALKQVTHLNSSLIAPTISFDGSTAAFGCDSGHSMSHDLCILDLNSGKVRKIGLLSDIRAAPE